MTGLLFETQPPAIAPHPNRVDIACFVGFVARRNTSLSSEMQRWLTEQGWTSPPYGRAAAQSQTSELGVEIGPPTLKDVPVPIDSWDVFDRLFAWERRPIQGSRQRVTTYLGAAVRSFFAQGGRRCYVVRVDDPWPLGLGSAERLNQIAKLIPGYQPGMRGMFDGSPLDPRTWHGVGHLFGLPDVSFVCLPDLPDAVGITPELPEVAIARRSIPEQFVECSEPEPDPLQDGSLRQLQAPRCDLSGYQEWARALNLVANLLRRSQREVQLVAAIPIPQAETSAEQDLFRFLTNPGELGSLALDLDEPLGLASAFVQLVYPWVRSPGSVQLPEQLESPDAILTGLLARNALTRGTFLSAANLHLADVSALEPLLPRRQTDALQADFASPNAPQHRLIERVSLLGPTPDGLRLRSDVTTSLSESYRPASINRLVASIVRAARRLGQDLTFESSGERLWGRLRASLNRLLLGLLQAGALQGKTPEDAFQVRCDRSTMTQADLDNGRAIAEIQFTATAPIEQITVILALNDTGQLALIPTQEAA